jgi:hypothetical protein
MPALNFKSRFAPLVAGGSKRHTIRAWRKRPFRVDDNLSFFTGMRTARCRRLRPNAACIAARPIELDVVKRAVNLNGKLLGAPEIEALATKDGFSDVDEFWRFFAQTHGAEVRGQLIEWNP